MMFWDGHNMGWGGWFTMSVGMIVFWGVLIAAAVLVFRASTRDHQPPPPPPRRSDAEDILSERFARGEIDQDEYQRRLSALRSQPPTSVSR